MKDSKIEKLQQIQKFIRPKIWSSVLLTFILIAPYGGLILKLLSNGQNVWKEVLFCFPSLTLLGWYWNWFIQTRRNYKKLSKEVYHEIVDPE